MTQLSSVAVLSVVTAAIVVQGKKAIQGVVDLANISLDSEVVT